MARAKKEFHNRRIDTASASVTYVGNYGGGLVDPELQDADPMWQIAIIYKVGTVQSFAKANDGAFNQIWNDRVTLFPVIP